MTTTPPVANPLIFYKLITPLWLKHHARHGFDLNQAKVSETKFEIPSDVRDHEALFQMNLLGRDVLRDDEDIVVKLKVGVEYPGDQPRSMPPRRPDPMIFSLWCPGEDESMGIQINDYKQYQTEDMGPCRGIEGEASNRGLNDLTPLPGRRTKDWYRFAEMFEFTYAPNSTGNGGRAGLPWSSAFTAVDTGTFDTFSPYFKNLRLSRGLNLGIYRDQDSEEYILKSVEISIFNNSPDVFGN